MRIIQVSSYYPPHLGGQENAAQDLSRQLAVAGHEVHVLTSTKGGGERGSQKEDGVFIHRMPGFEFGHAPIMPMFGPKLFHLANQNTVVHIHVGQAFTPETVWLLSKLRRFPYIAQLHIDFEPSGPAGILLPLYKRLLLQRVLHSAATVAVLNDKTLKIVQKTYGINSSKTMITNNGIDEAYFSISRAPFKKTPPKTLRLLFVGRLSKQKNLPSLLTALSKTKRNVHLDIIGDGDQRGVIKQQIQQQKLRNITLHGRLERKVVMNFYKTADALIMPSLYEAQPLVLLEAMAARIPIIGTEVIGVAEHIKDIGIIVPPTPEGLVEGIEQFYSSYPSLPKMVKNGFEKVEKFRWQHLLSEYETLYQEALSI